MKKILAIAFLLLFIYQLVGYYTIHQLQVYHIKKEIKRKIKNNIPKEELVSISFTLIEVDNIHWVKKGKEFIFNKRMYDIVESKAVADSITYYCIDDFKETRLFEQLNDHINNFIANDANQQDKTKRLIKLVKLDYFLQKDALSPTPGTVKKSIYISPIFNNYNIFQGVESPPPKC